MKTLLILLLLCSPAQASVLCDNQDDVLRQLTEIKAGLQETSKHIDQIAAEIQAQSLVLKRMDEINRYMEEFVAEGKK